MKLRGTQNWVVGDFQLSGIGMLFESESKRRWSRASMQMLLCTKLWENSLPRKKGGGGGGKGKIMR